MEGAATKVKDGVLEFAEKHPYILLALVSVLILIIIMMFLSNKGYGMQGFKGKSRRRKKNISLGGDEEVDSLIESIHRKQMSQRVNGTR